MAGTRRPIARGSAAPAPGAKTARGAATQAALVRAAQEVFERDGFLGARIADITATARTATRPPLGQRAEAPARPKQAPEPPRG